MLYALSLSKDNGDAGKLQGGFVHILLLVFLVLSLTLWGFSDIYFRATEKQQEAKRRGDSDLRLAVEALVDYATTPPPRVNTGDSFLPYNAVFDAPFRRFVLPCPDLIEGDNNLDGAADFSCSGGDDAYQPLVANSRFGRFPWRDDADSGVRGAGNRDFRGRYSERIWYIVSDNVVDRSDFPGNPNSLLKLTSGWLTLEENGRVVSDRIAALVIAPGVAVGAVVSEESLFAGEGAVPFTLSSLPVDISAFAAAYMDNGAYDSLATELRVSISTVADNNSSVDNYAYLTIDELVGAGSKGIKLVDDADGFRERNIYSQLEDGNGFLGISGLLQAHLNRYGYLPEPAVFSPENALERERLGIMISNEKVTITTSGDVVAGLTVSAVSTISNPGGINDPGGMFARNAAGVENEWLTYDLDGVDGGTGSDDTRVILGGVDYEITPMTVNSSFVAVARSGNALRSGEVSVSNPALAPTVLVQVADLPPVYIVSDITLSLVNINLINILPPYNIVLADLDTGLNREPLDSAVVSQLITDNHYPDNGLFGIYGSSGASLFAVDETNVEPNLDISSAAPITLQNGVPFVVALSEPAFGYFQGDSLVSIISYFDGDDTDISLLPPYGVRVLLPAGTRLSLDTSRVAINLPADYQARGSFDPDTGSWTLEPNNQAVLIVAQSDYVVAVAAAIPNDWPVLPGDFGFLPLNKDENTRILNIGVSVSLVAPGNAVSDLAVDIGLYTENRLTVMPFPPPGRPAASDLTISVSIMDPITVFMTSTLPGCCGGLATLTTTVNTVAAVTVNTTLGGTGITIASPATPLFIGEYSEFRLPVGTRISYPDGGVFDVGTDFAFPTDAMAYFPPGAVLQAILPISAVSPGGRDYNNSTMQTVLATLHHGGLLGVGSARAVLADGFGIGSGQELFDIEIRGLAQVLSGGSVIRTLPANSILQPYTGRAVDVVGPVSLGDEATLISPTRIRGRFLTGERNVVYHANNTVIMGNFAISSLVISGFASREITADFDEDTSFWIPAGEIRMNKSRVLGGGDATGYVPRIVLQAGTGIYDSDIESLYGTLSVPTDMEVDHPLTLNFYNISQESLNLELSVFRITSDSEVPTSVKVFTNVEYFTYQEPVPGNPISSVGSVTVVPLPRIGVSKIVTNPVLATANENMVLSDAIDNYSFLITSLSFTATVDGNLLSYGLEVGGPGNYQAYFSQITTTVTNQVHLSPADYRLNHFALFLDNDIYMNSNGVTTALLAGGVVDVVNANYWPPSGIQRLKRIASDLEMVSAGEMRIHLPERTALRTDIDEHIITLAGGVATVIVNPAPDSLVLSYTQYDGLDTDSARFEYLMLTVRGSLSLPANAMIIIPAGRPLEFLSENSGVRNFGGSPDIQLYAELVDYAHIPTEAVVIIPPGEEFYYYGDAVVEQLTATISHYTSLISSRITSGITIYEYGPSITLSLTVTSAVFPESGVVTMTGPGYFPLGDGTNRVAFVNNQAHLPAMPLVFLSETGVLRHGNIDNSLREYILAIVPAHSRIDMLGYTETRAEQGVFSDLLPANYESLLRDYPMGYAVAPACRRHAVAAGSKCGEGVGLTFNIPEDEEVVLNEDVDAPSGGLLSVTHPGASIIVRRQSFEDYFTGAVVTTTATVAAALIDDFSGLVSFLAPAVESNPGDVLFFEQAPHHTASVMRLYLGNLGFGDSIDGIHYADIDGVLTVHVGGVVRGQHENAAAAITLTSGTTLNLGVGAKLRGAASGEKSFGDGSFVSVEIGGNAVELALSDYAIKDALLYSADGTLAMAAAETDSFGGVFALYNPYDRIAVSGIRGTINLETIPEELIRVASDASIDMLPGYLWQGYMSPGGTLNFYDNTVTSPELGADVYLRVQPTVRALNFFGSGLERPEGLDSRSPAPVADIPFNLPPPVLGTSVYDTTGVILSVIAGDNVIRRAFNLHFFGSDLVIYVDSTFRTKQQFYNTVYSTVLLGSGTQLLEVDGFTATITAIGLPTLTVTRGIIDMTTTVTVMNSFPNVSIGSAFDTTLSLTNTVVSVVLYDDTTLSVDMNGGSTSTVFAGSYDLTVTVDTYTNYVPNYEVASMASFDFTGVTGTLTLKSKPNPNVGRALEETFTVVNAIITTLIYSDTTLSVSVVGEHVETVGALASHSEFTASIANYEFALDVTVLPGEGFLELFYEGYGTRVESLNNNNPVQSKVLHVRVRDDSGIRTVTATWNSSGVVWNRYSNPFPAATYASRFDSGPGYDLWGLPDVDDINGNSNPSYIDNFMCNGQPATANFSPPPFNMAASLVTPKSAWTISVSGVNYRGQTLALPVLNNGVGSGITINEQRRPDYVPLTSPPDYLSLSTPLPVSVNLSASSRQAVAHSDLVFYLDSSYNRRYELKTVINTVTNRIEHPDVVSTATLTVSVPANRTLPPQKLYFGDNFVLNGPGAIVPPFGGVNTAAVADVYAARSKLFNDLFSYPELSPNYDEMTGFCASINDCAAMFDNSDWIPIVGGAIAFGGVNVSVSGPAAPRLIMPQPQALVKDENGNTVTIYAGSMLFPQQNLIFPAIRLTQNYTLLMLGPGEAAIDVSPAIAPRPVRLLREESEFNILTVVQLYDNLGPFVLGVAGTVDYSVITSAIPRKILTDENFNYAPVAVTGGGGDCIVEPLAFDEEAIYNNFDENSGSYSAHGNYVRGATARFIMREGVNQIIRYDGSFTRGVLLNDQGADLIQDYFSGNPVYTEAHGFKPANLYNAFPRYNNDYQIGNPLSYHWVAPGAETFLPMGAQRVSILAGVEPSGINVENTGQFSALRLAHKISIPRTSIPIRAFQENIPYPSSPENMFQFPSGSEALAVNVDAGSWESIHPYLGLRSKGLQVALMTVSVALGVTTTVNRGVINVGQYDDAYVKSDIGNKWLSHYTRAETLPGDRAYSAADIYTNVWIRLPNGGILRAVSGGSEDIYLPGNSLVNPIMGTYLSGDFFTPSGGALVSDLFNSYLTRVVLNNDIEISRPAYVLPKGTKVAVGIGGARYTNVKAAVFFSLTPKDGVSCPYGTWRLGEEQSQVVEISQTREGVSENFYQAATGSGIVNIGHPCAWFDDPENTDGDNVFLYRGRRRHYVSDLHVREASNDRTYLVGGVLRIN